MARFKVSDKAKERKPFMLMPEGTQIIKVTKVEVKPKGNPKFILIEAVNSDGVSIRNRWDVTKEVQESMFWMFYNLGCGLDVDEEGYTDPDAMLGRFVEIVVKHTVLPATTVVDELTGEERELPERTFANFARINGNVSGFASVKESEPEAVYDEDVDSDGEDIPDFD